MSAPETRAHPLLLIRHAKAGDRSRWKGRDDLRPLSRPGRRQADGLVTLLAEFRLDRLVSSPSLRCIQTLAPLAASRRIEIEPDDALFEGAGGEAALALIYRIAPAGGAALCSHGDVIDAVLVELRERYVPLDGPAWAKKGSIWILELNQREIASGRYMPPPVV